MATVQTILNLEKTWKSRPYEDIITWCQVSKENSKICQDNNTWKYLLQRDYGKSYVGGDARSVYLQYRRIINHFSKYYPVITQQVVDFIHDKIPDNLWSTFDNVMEEYSANRISSGQEPVLILSLSEMGSLVDTVGDLLTDIEIPSPDQRKYFSSIYPNFRQYIDQISNEDCDTYLKIITKPTLIFVNTKPVIAMYDYDLAYGLRNYIENIDCSDDFWDIVDEYIVSLI